MAQKKSPSLKLALFLLISAVGTTISFQKGQAVSFQNQWPLYEALRNTAGIVFAVMGAWIAIIYPESLKNLSNPNTRTEENVLTLLQAMLISAVILASVLCVGIAVPILSQYKTLSTHSAVLRGLSYAFLSLMTIAQLWTLLLTILPNYIVKRNIIRRQTAAKLRTDMTEHKNRK